MAEYFVDIIRADNKTLQNRIGPMSNKKAREVEKATQFGLNSQLFYTRITKEEDEEDKETLTTLEQAILAVEETLVDLEQSDETDKAFFVGKIRGVLEKIKENSNG